MLLIAWFGRAIMQKLDFFKKHSGMLRKILGLIIIGTVGLMIYNEGYTGATFTTPTQNNEVKQTALINGITPSPAPDFVGITAWINSPPLTIEQLKGKVVLIDFWTYSCINCVRTLPYITKWDAEYRDKGLVIIGVHAPEFAFEKKLSNVQAAVEKYGIRYPVALDSDLATWTNFHNEYWPAHYLIDKQGNVVYTHFGEGDYNITENNIRVLLGLGAKKEMPVAQAPLAPAQTPETYLGYARAERFTGGSLINKRPAPYAFPSIVLLNHWALSGVWQIGAQAITVRKAGAALRLNFIARKVFLVMGTEDGKPRMVRVLLNGATPGKAAGADVKDGTVTVDHQGLYELIDQGATQNGVLELQTDDPGLQAYAFTFGD